MTTVVKVCKRCGAKFETTLNGTLYCSDCRKPPDARLSRIRSVAQAVIRQTPAGAEERRLEDLREVFAEHGYEVKGPRGTGKKRRYRL